MKKVRYLVERSEDRKDNSWDIIWVLDTKKEALAECKRNIKDRTWSKIQGMSYPPQSTRYRIVKRVEEVVFTEEGTEK